MTFLKIMKKDELKMTNPTLWYEKYNIFYYIIKTESM